MEGGWLIRKLGISETNSPFLFDKNCGPKDIDLIERKYNITRLL